MAKKILALFVAGLLILQDVHCQEKKDGGTGIAEILASGLIISLLTQGYSHGPKYHGTSRIPFLSALRQAILPEYSHPRIPTLPNIPYPRIPWVGPSVDVDGRYPHPYLFPVREEFPTGNLPLPPVHGGFRYSQSPVFSGNLLGGFDSHHLNSIYGQASIPFHTTDFLQPAPSALVSEGLFPFPQASEPFVILESKPDKPRFILPSLMRRLMGGAMDRTGP